MALSPADMVIIGAAALIFFGPDQLPKVARRAGQVIRDVQNTSQSFIREMEHAADVADERPSAEAESPPYEYRSYAEPSPAPMPHADNVAGGESAHDAPMHDPAPAVVTPDRNAHEDASGI